MRRKIRILKDTIKYAKAYYTHVTNAPSRDPYSRMYEVTEQEVLHLQDEARKWRNLAMGILNREHGGHK